MKIKHILASMGLTMMCGIGALVGLTHVNEMKMAKADADDEMISVVIDLGAIPTYDKFHKPEVHYYDASYSSIDKYEELHQLNGTYYTANLTYNSVTQNIDCIQFLFKQGTYGVDEVDKWSNSIALNSTSSNVYHYAFEGTWTGDNWDVQKDDTWWGVPRVRGNGISDTNFTADVSTKTYKVTGLSLAPGNTYQIFYGKWGFGAFRQSSIDNYLDNCSLNSFEVQTAGTYDIIAYNNYSDGGIFEIKLYSDADNRYIYYVLENNTPTIDYIYTWGGSEQFGAWPGTKITEVVGVQEVTNNGVLHFQGSETPKLIYKIPVTVGYPTGDSEFKFNKWEGDKSETAARPINGHSAYWWTGDANSTAGYAIDFLVEAEAIRNAAADYSVCNISKSNAQSLVSTYKSMGVYMQETYIDCTTVYTHKKDGSDGNELVSYRDVMVELARIAEVSLSSNRVTTRALVMNNVTIIVIIAISTVSFAALVTVLVIKKRKHN